MHPPSIARAVRDLPMSCGCLATCSKKGQRKSSSTPFPTRQVQWIQVHNQYPARCLSCSCSIPQANCDSTPDELFDCERGNSSSQKHKLSGNSRQPCGQNVSVRTFRNLFCCCRNRGQFSISRKLLGDLQWLCVCRCLHQRLPNDRLGTNRFRVRGGLPLPTPTNEQM